MKKFFGYFLLLLLFFLGGNTIHAQEVSKSRKTIAVSYVEKTLPENIYYGGGWEYASWKFSGNRFLVANYRCPVELILEFWPVRKPCYGYFNERLSEGDFKELQAREIEYFNKTLNVQLSKINDPTERILQDSIGNLNRMHLVNRQMAELQKFYDRNRELSNLEHTDLYNSMVEGVPYLEVGGQDYEISQFKDITKAAKINLESYIASVVLKDRVVVIFVGLLIILFAWYFYIVTVKMYKVICSRLEGADRKILEIPKKVKDLHDQHIFRNAVIDESAREMTRKTFKDADQRSQVVIQNAIIDALENGDKELAEALKSTLKK